MIMFKLNWSHQRDGKNAHFLKEIQAEFKVRRVLCCSYIAARHVGMPFNLVAPTYFSCTSNRCCEKSR